MLPKSKNNKNSYGGIKRKLESTSNRSQAARSIDPPSTNDHREQDENPVGSSVNYEEHKIVTGQESLVANKESKSASIARNIRPQSELTVKLPYPPTIKPKDLVDGLLKSKSQSPKMYNEFFIYRKAFVQELKKQNRRVKMTEVSSQASIYWRQETQKVKEAYRKLARDTERLYIQEKTTRRRSSTAVTSIPTTSASDSKETEPFDASIPSSINPNRPLLNNNNNDIQTFPVQNVHPTSYNPVDYELFELIQPEQYQYVLMDVPTVPSQHDSTAKEKTQDS